MKSQLAFLSIMAGIMPMIDAVTITNYEGVNCGGNSLTCSNIAQSECCYPLSGRMSSARFQGLPPTALGSIHRAEAGNNGGGCGTVLKSGSGLNICISGPSRGSMWHNMCSATCKRGEFEDFMSLPEAEQHQRLEKCDSIAYPDKLTLSDGHVFEIGNGTAPEDVESLLAVIEEKSNATIDDVPEHLQRYKL